MQSRVFARYTHVWGKGLFPVGVDEDGVNENADDADADAGGCRRMK